MTQDVLGTQAQYRTVRVRDFSGGMRDNSPATQIEDGESPNSLNIEFDRGSIATTRGCRKFGNQVAPSSGVRCRVDPALSPLSFASGMSVPLRGYIQLPYIATSDIGGDANADLHARRGRSFERDVAFKIPIEERLFDSPRLGSGAPTTPDVNFNPAHGFDEALDECFIVAQKGGDRTAPMSWAIGVVNIGNGVGLAAPTSRQSNYGLVFMWFDAPGWGLNVPASMRYTLTTGQHPDTGAYSTQAFRAILIHKFVEPGKKYNVAFQLQVDSGSQGSTGVNTAWNNDGFFKVWVREENRPVESFTAIDGGGGVVFTGMEVYKGPSDSGTYLAKYGVRYSATDAEFLGLGFRPHVWKLGSFIPWGMDAAPRETGGQRMLDRSAHTTDDIYGAGIYTLTISKAANADAFVTVNFRGLSAGNNNGGTAPMGFWGGAAYLEWAGLNAAGVGGAPFNPQAIAGYRLIFPADIAGPGEAGTPGAPAAKGGILNIISYAEAPGFRLTITNGSTINAFAATKVLVQAFRWHQRDLIISDYRCWSVPRIYDDANAVLASRRKLSLGRTVRLDDPTEPDIATLQAYWPLDDSQGSVVEERVVGGLRNGFFCPGALGVTDAGQRSRGMVFLSGEMEAPCIDFSSDPIIKREIEAMLKSPTQGFAIEISCMFPEAFYGIAGPPINLPDTTTGLLGTKPRFVPDVLSWDVKGSETTGAKVAPRPIIGLSYRGIYHDTGQTKFGYPLVPMVVVGHRSDQDDIDGSTPPDLSPWYLNAATVETPRFALNAPWVGRRVTIQIGVQPTAVADQYDVYMAMSPKDAWKPVSGDPSDAEWTLWTDGNTTYDASIQGHYFNTAHLTIRKKDIFRSILTIGGRYTPLGAGYSELNCRMLLDEVRIFATSGPGALPPLSGGIVTTRDGKLSGGKCLPERALTSDDILLPLGSGLSAVNVTERSAVITPGGSARFFTGLASDSAQAVKDCYLRISGDTAILPNEETIASQAPDIHRIASVAADGSSLTLALGINAPTRTNIKAAIVRLIGYTDFEDAFPDGAISFGSKAPYSPASSTSAIIVLTEELWANKAPALEGFRVRVFPIGIPLSAILPQWTRGLLSPNRGHTGQGILGLGVQNDTVFSAVRGALYESDDRWRSDGPTLAITQSLEFRHRDEPQAGLLVPLQADAIDLAAYTGFVVNHGSSDANVTFYDAWVKLDHYHNYQTITWVGDRNTDPARSAGTGALAHRFYSSIRLNKGRPEIVFGSTSTYDGTNRPEKGLFAATGTSTVDPGTWVHIRFYIETRLAGTVITVPFLKVNGKAVPVTVNAKDNGVAGANDWLLVSGLVSPSAQNGHVLIGISRDSFKASVLSGPFASTGPELMPARIQGFLHSLGGELADLAVGKVTHWAGTSPPDFDPQSIDYTGATMQIHMLGALSEGRGAKIKEQVGSTYGIILSHPFISLYHQFGKSDLPATFARFGQQTYVANGGRPALINNGTGKPAGLLPPSTVPDFAVTRLPIWSPNVRDQTTATGPNNDPINAAPSTAAQLVYHYRFDGNTYLSSLIAATPAMTALSWGQFGYFGFKGYIRPQTVAGRSNLWRKGVGKDIGGPFVEIRDGHLVIGWFDVTTKTELSVMTDRAVFTPGLVHYVNVRKMWPQQDILEGNWVNSYFSGGQLRRMTVTALAGGQFAVGNVIQNGGATIKATVIKAYAPVTTTQTIEYVLWLGADFNGVAISSGGVTATSATNANTTRPMHDLAVVRSFPNALPAIYGELDVKPAFIFADPAGRTCVSFTSDFGQAPAGTTATGLVSSPGLTFSGSGVAGAVNAVPNASCFTPDMVGMFWQWGSAAAVGATIYRVSAYTNASAIVVVNLDGSAAPVWNAVTSQLGGVFSGVSLVNTAAFDVASLPDTSPGTVEMFGSSLTGDPLSGFAPFIGDVWCPAYCMAISTKTDKNEGALPFENRDSSRAGAANNDPMYVGTDKFDYAIYDGLDGAPAELRADALLVFWGVDLQTYAGAGGGVSTQPTITLQLPGDTSPTVSSTVPSYPSFRYVQTPEVWNQIQYVGCAYFDPEQGIVSNPGEILRVRPAPSDTLNPSGTARLLLSSLPVSRDPGALELHIFKSIAGTTPDGGLLNAGSSAVQRRVAIVPSGTDEASLQSTDIILAETPLLEFDNDPPPDCRIVCTAQGSRIMYGALTTLQQLDGVFYSKAFLPAQVPALNAFRVNVGPGDAVTGMAELNGHLVVLKRRSVFGITINSDGLVDQRPLTGGAGCVSPQTVLALDDSLLWFGDRGFYVYTRTMSPLDFGASKWVGERIKNFFASGIDPQAAFRSGSGINRVRHQYLATFRRPGLQRMDGRIGFNGEAFGVYRDPEVTAMADVQPSGGGPPRVVAGTEDGFAIWMDDPSTQLLLLGPDANPDGTPSHVAAAGATTTAIILAGVTPLDTDLEGMRGSIVRWQKAGVDYSAQITGIDGRTVHLRTVQVAATLPSAGDVITIGEQRHSWESKWFDLGNFEKRKRSLYLDLEMATATGTGTIDVLFYSDRNETQLQKPKYKLPVNGLKLPLTPDLYANWVKVKIVSTPLVPGAKFEITGIVQRPGESDQT